MIVKFEPSGTHVRNNKLIIRLDFYPEVGDKTYTIHRVRRDNKWVVNPCLCYLTAVDPDITLATLDTLVQMSFNGVTKTAIDDAMIEANSSSLIGTILRGISFAAPTLTVEPDIAAINTRLSSLEVSI